MVFTDWPSLASVLGSLICASGPDVRHGVASSGLAALLGLELKHN